MSDLMSAAIQATSGTSGPGQPQGQDVSALLVQLIQQLADANSQQQKLFQQFQQQPQQQQQQQGVPIAAVQTTITSSKESEMQNRQDRTKLEKFTELVAVMKEYTFPSPTKDPAFFSFLVNSLYALFVETSTSLNTQTCIREFVLSPIISLFRRDATDALMRDLSLDDQSKMIDLFTDLAQVVAKEKDVAKWKSETDPIVGRGKSTIIIIYSRIPNILILITALFCASSHSSTSAILKETNFTKWSDITQKIKLAIDRDIIGKNSEEAHLREKLCQKELEILIRSITPSFESNSTHSSPTNTPPKNRSDPSNTSPGASGSPTQLTSQGNQQQNNRNNSNNNNNRNNTRNGDRNGNNNNNAGNGNRPNRRGPCITCQHILRSNTTLPVDVKNFMEARVNTHTDDQCLAFQPDPSNARIPATVNNIPQARTLDEINRLLLERRAAATTARANVQNLAGQRRQRSGRP